MKVPLTFNFFETFLFKARGDRSVLPTGLQVRKGLNIQQRKLKKKKKLCFYTHLKNISETSNLNIDFKF